MALKPHQKFGLDDINFICENVAAKGCLVAYTTAGNVAKTADLAKKVAGVLLIDVVAGIHPSNVTLGDFTGTIDRARNFQKNETHVSGVVRLMKIGEVQTNAVSGTFNPGDVVRHGGGAGNFRVGGGGEVVGHALSTKDADGYVKIYVNIS